MKTKSKKSKVDRKIPKIKKEYTSAILEFEVIWPTNDQDMIGEKLPLSVFGEYGPRGYTLLYLLDHPAHYRVSRVLMRGIKYEIPIDREKNWRPKQHPELNKYIVA